MVPGGSDLGAQAGVGDRALRVGTVAMVVEVGGDPGLSGGGAHFTRSRASTCSSIARGSAPAGTRRHLTERLEQHAGRLRTASPGIEHCSMVDLGDEAAPDEAQRHR